MEKDKLLRLDNEMGLMEFLKEPTVKIAEALTGIFSSGVTNWKLSAGRLVQACIKGDLLTQLGREMEKYRNEGKIKEDYFASRKNRATLFELLQFLDEEIPDDDLFRALKSIFFCGISVGATNNDEVLAYEFLKTAKKLSGTEILILRASFEIAQKKFLQDVSESELALGVDQRNMWRKVIAKQMGYESLDSIVFKYEENLEILGLIQPRFTEINLARFAKTPYFRLTNTGYKFCEFIMSYDDPLEN